MSPWMSPCPHVAQECLRGLPPKGGRWRRIRLHDRPFSHTLTASASDTQWDSRCPHPLLYSAFVVSSSSQGGWFRSLIPATSSTDPAVVIWKRLPIDIDLVVRVTLDRTSTQITSTRPPLSCRIPNCNCMLLSLLPVSNPTSPAGEEGRRQHDEQGNPDRQGFEIYKDKPHTPVAPCSGPPVEREISVPPPFNTLIPPYPVL